MPTYKIKLSNPLKKSSYNKIIKAPSIASAEYYAIDEMLLKSKYLSIEEHFQLGVTPFIKSIVRGKYKSNFQFNSELLGKKSPIYTITINHTLDKKSHIDYDLIAESILDLWETTNPQKIVRLCWNNNDWESPSGPAGKSKSTAKTFEKEQGYGYEEWFFDTSKQIAGYHYAFLRPFEHGMHEGEIYDLHLYAIKDSKKTKEKLWIGYIKNVEVITTQEADKILSLYKKNGWYEEMASQVKNVVPNNPKSTILDGYLFNVKFKIESKNYVRYEPYVPIRNFEKEIKSAHYVLLDKLTDEIDTIISGKFDFIQGHKNTKTGQIKSTYSKSFYNKNLYHKEIQESIYKQLLKKYTNSEILIGTEIKTGFGTQIDLVVKNPKEEYTFYEIKTGVSALSCIREAIGQLLEYCYYPNNNYASKLIIIAPFKIDEIITIYMKHLKENLNIPIYYQFYSFEKKILEDLIV